MTLHLTEHDRLGLLSGVDQIADFLNCSRQRVERMIETGQLAPVFFLGRTPCVRRETLRAWLREPEELARSAGSRRS
ncbi:DNA binding domain protein, excisionase family [Methylobacterium sp. 4-46]|uniref:excisionase family DNA-binding protein n=1 Tax=unclassified Methylobacterium TaxID=2615210 RepID=UPI000165C88E|nr:MULTISPECIES: excisionase family DNA-binding protein [Methylobacterium]ACA15688.1 DNA binding domain protein, excisionase family [Methylobacterium sp. 4-46]WFT81399.1 excisionase family DNA-binding protein [Methylobacterium nodulans]